MKKKRKGFKGIIVALVVLVLAGSALSGDKEKVNAKPNTENGGNQTVTEIKEEPKPQQSAPVQNPAPQQQTPAPKPEEKPKTGGISKDLKAFLDSYESFMDEYCSFMANYNPSDLNQLAKYGSLMKKYADFADKAEKYKDTDMNTEETAYYIEVMSRVEGKLLKTLGKM